MSYPRRPPAGTRSGGDKAGINESASVISDTTFLGDYLVIEGVSTLAAPAVIALRQVVERANAGKN